MATGNTIADKINDIENSKQLIIAELESKGMIFTKTVMLSDLHTEVKNSLVLNSNYYPIPSDNSVFTFTASGSTYEVAGTAKCPAKTIIPKTYSGKNVTKIKDSGFLNNSTTNLICIPNTVTSIGTSAFSGCTKLNDVRIPNTVTSIGGSAFKGCSVLEKIYIPSSIKNIESNTFSDCVKLNNIEIPIEVTNIGNESFKNCSSLKNLTIPNGNVNIGYNAFLNCPLLLNIPNKKCIDIKQMLNYPWGLADGTIIQGSDNKIEVGNILPAGYKRVEYISNQKVTSSIYLPTDTKTIEMTFKHINSSCTDGSFYSFGQFPNYAFEIDTSKKLSLWGNGPSTSQVLKSNEITKMLYQIGHTTRTLRCKSTTDTTWKECGSDDYPTKKLEYEEFPSSDEWGGGGYIEWTPTNYFNIKGSKCQSQWGPIFGPGYVPQEPGGSINGTANINMDIYQFMTKNSSGTVTMNLIPCTDASGKECLFNEISQKTIY